MTNEKFNIKRVELFGLMVVLLVASFLRLYRIESKMRFIWDEGRDMLAIRHMLVNKDLTLFGPFNEIGGTKDFFGVFHYYLMAPWLRAANFDPIGPAVFTAILGVISVGLVYVLLKMWKSPPFVLWLTLVAYAFSPLVIRYVQWPWNPNTTAFFCLIYFIVLTSFLRQSRLIFSLLAGLLLGLMFQLHYFTIAAGMAYFVIFWTSSEPLRRKVAHGLLFTLGFLLPNLSFVLFDMTHEGFYSKIIIETLTGDGSQKYLLQGENILSIVPKNIINVFSGLLNLPVLVGGLITAGVTVMAIFVFLNYKKSKKISLALLILVSLITYAVVIFFFPSLPNEYHSSFIWWGFVYFVVLALHQITLRFSPASVWWKVGAVIFSLWLIYSVDLFRVSNWDENKPLVQAAGESIAKDATINDYSSINVASLVDADTRAIRFRYFIVNLGIELEGIDRYPTSHVLYVISHQDWNNSMQNPAWELDSFRDITGELVFEQENYFVYRAVKEE